MYVYMYVCNVCNVCMYVCVHVCMHACMHVYIYASIDVCAHVINNYIRLAYDE